MFPPTSRVVARRRTAPSPLACQHSTDDFVHFPIGLLMLFSTVRHDQAPRTPECHVSPVTHLARLNFSCVRRSAGQFWRVDQRHHILNLLANLELAHRLTAHGVDPDADERVVGQVQPRHGRLQDGCSGRAAVLAGGLAGGATGHLVLHQDGLDCRDEGLDIAGVVLGGLCVGVH